jgi:hypothetical protein
MTAAERKEIVACNRRIHLHVLKEKLRQIEHALAYFVGLRRRRRRPASKPKRLRR